MTPEAIPTILAAVPPTVQRHIGFHLGVLREISQGITQARAMERLAGALGRYEYDFRFGAAAAQARLDASLQALATVQALAEAKGLDWAALCTALGGYATPPAIGPAVEAWRPPTPPPAQDA